MVSWSARAFTSLGLSWLWPKLDLTEGHGALSLFHGYRESQISLESPWMIVSFGDRQTKDLFHGRSTARVRRFPRDVVRLARRKLDVLNAACRLLDLRAPPGNRLEALKGKLDGFHSIRVNDQWRVAFRWEGNHAHEVRLTDYHS